jgi:hypothetical protein
MRVPRRVELLAAAWDCALGGRVPRSLRAPTLLCLAYHRVADDVASDHNVVSARPAELDWQAGWLRRRAHVVGGDELIALLRGAQSLTEPGVCLTFDDGYVDNFAAGVTLARHGVPAIFFVATGFVETGAIPWWERLAYAVKHTARRTLTIRSVDGRGPWTLDNADRAAAARAARGRDARRRGPPRAPRALRARGRRRRAAPSRVAGSSPPTRA